VNNADYTKVTNEEYVRVTKHKIKNSLHLIQGSRVTGKKTNILWVYNKLVNQRRYQAKWFVVSKVTDHFRDIVMSLQMWHYSVLF